jgi:hypothetical protein
MLWHGISFYFSSWQKPSQAQNKSAGAARGGTIFGGVAGAGYVLIDYGHHHNLFPKIWQSCLQIG